MTSGIEIHFSQKRNCFKVFSLFLAGLTVTIGKAVYVVGVMSTADKKCRNDSKVFLNVQNYTRFLKTVMHKEYPCTPIIPNPNDTLCNEDGGTDHQSVKKDLSSFCKFFSLIAW